MAEQQASLDFAYQAVGRVAELAKQIVARHYAKPPDRSYFAGCSTGGREAMLMTQRYPRYFDGVIAGAPAMRTNFSGIGDAWVATMLNTVAPKDAQGVPQVRQALSDVDKKLVIDGVLNACDANDGVKDGMIFDQLSCKFDPKMLACKGAKTDAASRWSRRSRSRRDLPARRTRRAGRCIPASSTTPASRPRRAFAGLLHGGLEPGRPAVRGDDRWTWTRGPRAAAADPAEALIATSRWTNLNTFSNHGGKLIFFHGVSDPWFSALDTHRLLRADDRGQRRRRAGDGLEPAVPGAGHGPLPAAVRRRSTSSICSRRWWTGWRRAPRRTPCRRPDAALPGRSRPLCAYPQHAHYKGTGDSQDARNFECRD